MNTFIKSTDLNDINNHDVLMINLDPDITIYKSVTVCYITSDKLNIFLQIDFKTYQEILTDIIEFQKIQLSIDDSDNFKDYTFKNYEFVGVKNDN